MNGENPHRHGEDLQTEHRIYPETPASTFDLTTHDGTFNIIDIVTYCVSISVCSVSRYGRILVTFGVSEVHVNIYGI